MDEANNYNEHKDLVSNATSDAASSIRPYEALWDFIRERKVLTMPPKSERLTSTSEASKKKSSVEFDNIFLKPRMIHLETENLQYFRLALRDEFHRVLCNIASDHDEHELIQDLLKLLQQSKPVADFELSRSMTGLLERLLKAQCIGPTSFQAVQDRFSARLLVHVDELEKHFADVISYFKKSKKNESNWESLWDNILLGNCQAPSIIEKSDPSLLEKQAQYCFIEKRFKCPIRDRSAGAKTNILGPPPLRECVRGFRISDASERTRNKVPQFGEVLSKPFNLSLAPVAKKGARRNDFLIDAAFNFWCDEDYAQQPFIRLSNISGGCPLILYEFKNSHESGKREEGERYLAFTSTIFLWEIVQLTALGENLGQMSESGLPQDGIPIHNHSHFRFHSVLICGSIFHFYRTRIATQKEAEAQYMHSSKNLPVSFIFERLATMTVDGLNDLKTVFQFLATITVDAYYNIRPALVNYGMLLKGNSTWGKNNAWINDFNAALTYRTTNVDGDAPYTLVPTDNFHVIFIDEDSDNDDDDGDQAEGQLDNPSDKHGSPPKTHHLTRRSGIPRMTSTVRGRGVTRGARGSQGERERYARGSRTTRRGGTREEQQGV
ncbi:MAG: hypothetical protein Q9165_003466 [Trypethelium subeluteriae]